MQYNKNIEFINSHEQGKIDKALKSLFYDKTPEIKKLVAIKYLKKHLVETLIREKLEWLLEREKSPNIIRQLESVLKD